MATILNKFFSTVFTEEDTNHLPTFDSITDAAVCNINITEAEVCKKLNNLKPFSAPGPDGIQAKLLKDFSGVLSGPLCKIFNKSMQEGIVPDDWRNAHVTPIYKKGSKSSPGNYRPVSLTSIPCKVMESLIKDVITKHLTDNLLIRTSQHGFMSKRSTTTNLLQFMETITKNFDDGHPLDVIYLDFQKAFDKVPWGRLMAKMEGHGIKGKILTWIRSWLSNRKQRVVLNGCFSDWLEVISGVPQGSVLGPLAFLIFINDLDDDIMDIILSIMKFADDTKVANAILDASDHRDLQRALDNLVRWTDTWGMSFNVSKCKVMHIGRNNQEYTYSMNSRQLDITKEEKDVGVLITDNLKPSRQCAEAARRASTVLYQLCKAFHYRDRHIFKKLYLTYVRPHLEYCVQAWCPWFEHDIELLEKVQKKAIRQITGLSASTYEDKLKELGIESLRQRRVRFDLLQTYKIINGIDKVDKSIWFTLVSEIDGRNTRLNDCPFNLVREKVSRTEIRNNFFSQRVISTWNALPSFVKESQSLNAFKYNYDNYLETISS